MKINKFNEVLSQMKEVYELKNRNYGDSFTELMDEYGNISLAIRLGDKYNRFKSLISLGSEGTNDESIEDTLMDLANYAVMGIVYNRIKNLEAKPSLPRGEWQQSSSYDAPIALYGSASISRKEDSEIEDETLKSYVSVFSSPSRLTNMKDISELFNKYNSKENELLEEEVLKFPREMELWDDHEEHSIIDTVVGYVDGGDFKGYVVMTGMGDGESPYESSYYIYQNGRELCE